MIKTENDSKNKGGNLIWIILIVTIINAFLVLYVLRISERELYGDEVQYHQLTLNLMDHSAFSLETNPPFDPTLNRTPGYPLIVAFLYLISGKSILFAKIFQFLLSGINAYLLYQLAKIYVDEKTARISSYLFLIYFPFIFISAFLFTETVSIFLILSLLLLIKKYGWQNNGQILLDLVIGIVMGVLVMVRPTMALIVIPLGLILWIPYFFKKSLLPFNKVLAKSFILACGLLLIFTPWIIMS